MIKKTNSLWNNLKCEFDIDQEFWLEGHHMWVCSDNKMFPKCNAKEESCGTNKKT